MPKLYSPRRASKKWLEGAPDYVLDILWDRDYPNDGLMVILSKEFMSQRGEYAESWVTFLSLSENGVLGGADELNAYDMASYRYKNGKDRVAWKDIPEAAKQWVISWCES